jgi:type I restriction enzyme R subunit
MQEMFRRRRLPHWDVPGATYFVTTCLAGSIPAQGLLEIEQHRRSLDRQKKPADLSEEDFAVRKWKQLFVVYERWLDEHPASRHLADSRLAEIVVNSIRHFAGERYELWSYVVMPSHIHWVFRPLDEWVKRAVPDGSKRSPRESILTSVNSYAGGVATKYCEARIHSGSANRSITGFATMRSSSASSTTLNSIQ